MEVAKLQPHACMSSRGESLHNALSSSVLSPLSLQHTVPVTITRLPFLRIRTDRYTQLCVQHVRHAWCTVYTVEPVIFRMLENVDTCLNWN